LVGRIRNLRRGLVLWNVFFNASRMFVFSAVVAFLLNEFGSQSTG